MKDLGTIRIYFASGQKVNEHSSWKKLYSFNFSTELMTRAKAFGLQQLLHLNVSKGYLNHQKINWGISEIRHNKHPNLIEISDSELKFKSISRRKEKSVTGNKCINC